MDDHYQALLSDAFRFLSFRTRSSQELNQYLEKRIQKRKYSQDVKTQVLARLAELNYLNDAKFATEWVESRIRSKHTGPARLKQELRAKGIANETIEQALAASIQDPEMQYKTAAAALSKKLNLWQKQPQIVFKRKVYDYLLRKGFPSSLALRLVDETARKAYNTGTEITD